jgi:hypothetical protein
MENVEFDSLIRSVLAERVQFGTNEKKEPLSVEHVTEIRRRFDGILAEALADAHERQAKRERGEVA